MGLESECVLCGGVSVCGGCVCVRGGLLEVGNTIMNVL